MKTVHYFYIPTVYIRVKDNTLFFVHERSKILNVPKESIGYVVSAELIESDENYTTYNFSSINLDKHIEDVFDKIIKAKVLLVKKLSDPDFLFGVLLDQTVLERVKETFPDYNAPESNAFVKISLNKANLSVEYFSEMLKKLHNFPFVCDCKIYYATSSLLYAHPLKYRIDNSLKEVYGEIRRTVKQREKYSKAKKLIRNISLIYKDNNFKLHDTYVEFDAHGKHYKISFVTEQVYENDTMICVQCPASFCREDIVLAKALNIIVNPDSISTLNQEEEEDNEDE